MQLIHRRVTGVDGRTLEGIMARANDICESLEVQERHISSIDVHILPGEEIRYEAVISYYYWPDRHGDQNEGEAE